MKPLSPSDIDHLARLVRLTLTDAERVRFADQLSRILAYVATLESIDTTGIGLWFDGRSAAKGERSAEAGQGGEDLVTPFLETRALEGQRNGPLIRLSQRL